MTIIAFNDVAAFLDPAKASDWPVVTLVYGEELLCKKAFDRILDRLVPEADRLTGLEVFDGGEATLGDVLSSMNTFALLSRSKVVVLHDARLFYSAKAQQGLREKIALNAQRGEWKKASRPFLNLMALCGLEFEDLTTPASRRKVADDVDGEPVAWLNPLVAFCREKGLRIPETRDDGERLKTAMDKGFPDGHRLLITTDFVDRRKALFKTIDESGLVVDCSVPLGETRSDRQAQDGVMQAIIADILDRSGKRMDVNARQRLVQLTGFDLRTLSGNLEKLLSFIGDRRSVTEADVNNVLQRTRKDPIFEFTNAVAERNLPAALSSMRSLLDDEMHPLQLLAALANQIRRLLLARAFLQRDRERAWSPSMTFPQFKTAPFKAIQADDDQFAALVQSWESMTNPQTEGRKAKSAVAGDLLLARNAKSPFPVYQTLQKADTFSLEALSTAMIDLSETDRRMKSTGQDPRLLLEAFLVRFCRKAGRKMDSAGSR